MQLVIMIIHDSDHMNSILVKMMEAGIKGGSLIDCEGALGNRARILGSAACFRLPARIFKPRKCRKKQASSLRYGGREGRGCKTDCKRSHRRALKAQYRRYVLPAAAVTRGIEIILNLIRRKNLCSFCFLY